MHNSVLDFSKFFCPYHPSELITNFCEKSECLVGLCSHCICEHTEMHTRTKTSPKYKSIKECHDGAQGQLKTVINSLKESQERIVSIDDAVSVRKKQLKQLIESTKKTVIARVEHAFSQILTNIESRIAEEEKNTGFHTNYKMELMSNQISRQISQITQCSRDLNSTHFLSTVKKLKREDFQYFITNRNKINQQIKHNQIFQPSITFHKNKINEIQIIVKKMFALNFTYPGALKKQQKVKPKSNICISPTKLVPKMISSGTNFFNPSLMPNHSYNKTPNQSYSKTVAQSYNKTPTPSYNKTQIMTKPYEVVFNLSSPSRVREPLQPRIENISIENESEMKRNKSVGLTLTKSKNHSTSKSRLQEQDLAQSLLISTIK